jgi:hypothetical protein
VCTIPLTLRLTNVSTSDLWHLHVDGSGTLPQMH